MATSLESLRISNSKIAEFRNLRGLRIIDDIERFYLFDELLGEGKFGSVYKAFNKTSNQKCAIKICDKLRIERSE